jgi:hypothetical protein
MNQIRRRLALLLSPVVLPACVHDAPPPVAPVPPAPAQVASSPPPPAPSPPQSLPDAYVGCPAVRRIGDAPLDAHARAEARAWGWMWPRPCGQVSGWAGIGIALSTQAVAFSGNGTQVVVCGVSPHDACVGYDLTLGRIVAEIPSAWPGGPDGTPVTETGPVKAFLQRLGAPAPQGALPFPDDLFASWRVAPNGGALEVTLVAIATGDERVVARFPGPSGTSDQPIVLQGATVSPDGAHFEAHVFTGQGGTGFQVAVVNVYAEAAALFRDVVQRHGDARGLAGKASQAEARGRVFMGTFVTGGPGARQGQ